LNGGDDLAAVVRAPALDGDLPDGAIALRVDGVDGHDRATRTGDGSRDLPEHAARPRREGDAEGQGELCGCGGHRLGSYERQHRSPWLRRFSFHFAMEGALPVD